MSVLLTSEIQTALKDQANTFSTIFAQVTSHDDFDIHVCNLHDVALKDGILIAHLSVEAGRYTTVQINGKPVNVFAKNFYPVPVKFNPTDNTLTYELHQYFNERPLDSIAVHNHIVQNDLVGEFDTFKGHNNSTIIGFNPFMDNPKPFTSHKVTQTISESDLNQNISNAISHVEDIIKPKLLKIAQSMKPNSHVVFDMGLKGKSFEQIFA